MAQESEQCSSAFAVCSSKRQLGRGEPVWDSVIHPSHIVISNRVPLLLREQHICLPSCPSVGQILHRAYPNFTFDNTHRKQQTETYTAFYAFGDQNNKVRILPTVVESSSSVLIFRLRASVSANIAVGGLKIIILALTLVHAQGVYLRCGKDLSTPHCAPAIVQREVLSSGFEPQFTVTGIPVTSSNLNQCYFLVRKPKSRLAKPFARLSAETTEECRVRSIRLGKTHLRISVTAPAQETPVWGLVTTSFSLTPTAPLAFDRNPYNHETFACNARHYIPVIYSGPKITLAPRGRQVVWHNNSYTSSLPCKVTAIVSNHCCNCDIFLEDSEWRPNKPAPLKLVNTSDHPVILEPDTHIGNALFIIAPKARGLRRLTRLTTKTIELPGGVKIDSRKLQTFRKMYVATGRS
nr:ORF11 [Human gammaherpesvirus 8]